VSVTGDDVQAPMELSWRLPNLKFNGIAFTSMLPEIPSVWEAAFSSKQLGNSASAWELPAELEKFKGKEVALEGATRQSSPVVVEVQHAPKGPAEAEVYTPKKEKDVRWHTEANPSSEVSELTVESGRLRPLLLPPRYPADADGEMPHGSPGILAAVKARRVSNQLESSGDVIGYTPLERSPRADLLVLSPMVMPPAEPAVEC